MLTGQRENRMTCYHSIKALFSFNHTSTFYYDVNNFFKSITITDFLVVMQLRVVVLGLSLEYKNNFLKKEIAQLFALGSNAICLVL